MKVTFNVDWWVDIRRENNEVIFETSDGNGNQIELRFDEKDFFNKRHLKHFIRSLESLKNKEARKR